MKNLISLLLLITPLISYSQDSIFNYLKANTTVSSEILVRFELKSGNTCDGIRIEKSTDNLNFETIHFIDGICGNSSEAVAYQFTDETPVSNQTNYYRIVPGFGTATQAVSVYFIDLNTDGYYLFPNPTENQTEIHFQNNDHSNVKLNLINYQGQIVLSEQTNSNLWMPDLTLLPSGIYFFSIEFNQKVISGKIIKK